MTDVAVSRRTRLTDRWPTAMAMTMAMTIVAVAGAAFVLLVGIAFLAPGARDAYYHRQNKVVHRPYAEFCGVLDATAGPALIVAALAY